MHLNLHYPYKILDVKLFLKIDHKYWLFSKQDRQRIDNEAFYVFKKGCITQAWYKLPIAS